MVAETPAVGALPVPVRPTDCGLPVALSEIMSVAVRPEMAVGLNVTAIAQLPFAATELPQVFVCAKSLALAPVSETLVRA